MRSSWKNAARRTLSVLLACVLLVGCVGFTALAADATGDTLAQESLPELRLWYDEPSSQTPRLRTAGNGYGGDDAYHVDANKWQQNTLPIGNGDLCANVYGEIGTERLTLNEKTLWDGGRNTADLNGANDNSAGKIRTTGYKGGNLDSNGQDGEGLEALQGKFLENPLYSGSVGALFGRSFDLANGYGNFLPWGELRVATDGLSDTSTVTDYQRWLSLDKGVAGVSFQSGGVTYTREYIASNPDKVIAAKFTATESKTFTITLPGHMNGHSNAQSAVVEGSDTLVLKGSLNDNGLKYASYLKAVGTNGTTVAAGTNALTVTGTEFTLFFSAATDYSTDFTDSTGTIQYYYRTGETDAHLAERVQAVVTAAVAKGYDTVKTAHSEDYSSLYDRMVLDLGQTESTWTTDDLLAAYNDQSNKPTDHTITAGEQRLLEVMLYQYGRYLTISASREDSQLPTNLQGGWNYLDEPAWHSDYHLNVNLQMNYWPTYVTNLAECAKPLVNFMESLREPGRITAKTYLGIDDDGTGTSGFMAHTQVTPYGWTCPGSGQLFWAWSPGVVPWMLQNCWDYYEFTQDFDYMRDYIYPIMKESARMYDNLLIDVNPDEDIVELAVTPAASPEQGPNAFATTYEQSLAWQLYTDVITAAKLVGDTQFVDTWQYNLDHLYGPIEVGESGQIKEWYHEVEFNKDANGNSLGEGYGHRHISHLLGLFPGDLIQASEEWTDAALWTMNNRTFNSTGWGMGQRINTWARLRQGEKAHQLIRNLFSGGIYSNLWDSHAPFQIDGNFGYTSGVAEMLIQSNAGFIDLLPALPSAWASGHADGLMARGNFELEMTWDDSLLTRADILSKSGGECVVYYPGISRAQITDANGSRVSFEVVGKDKVSFQTEKDKTYTISSVPEVEEPTQIQNIGAFRTSEDDVTVTWDALDGYEGQYTVYRRVGYGEIVSLGVTHDTKFIDVTAYEALGDLRYYVAKGNQEPSAYAAVRDLRNMIGMIDDRDSRIVYSSGNSTTNWGQWNGSGEGNYNNTVSFLENEVGQDPDPNSVGQTIDFAFVGTGIKVYGVKNRHYGQFSVEVDGVYIGIADCYNSSRQAQQVLWESGDLAYGFHTIKLTRLGTRNSSAAADGYGHWVNKVEFDAFEVLNSHVEEEPDTPLEITNLSGATKLWKSMDSIQFTANLPGVTWSLTSTLEDTYDNCYNTGSSAASEHSDKYHTHHTAFLSSDGLLTAGKRAETVTVTATKGTQQKSVTVTISPDPVLTIIEDAIRAENGTTSANTAADSKGNQITYNGSWAPYGGEDKHHGHTKTESSGNGNTITFTFNGTGVAVYGTEHFNNGKATVTLDSAAQPDILAYDPDNSGVNNSQVRLAEYTDLTAGEHTLVLTVAPADNGKTHFVLDFFEVYSTNTSAPSASLTELLNAVNSCATLDAEDYSETSWEALTDVLNNPDVAAALNNTASPALGQNDVDALTAAITGAKEALVPKGVEPPAAPTGLTVSNVAGSSAVLKWTAVDSATSYLITVNGNDPIEVTNTVYNLTGLASGKNYSVTVAAKNSAGQSASSEAKSFTTLDIDAPDAPTDLALDTATKTLTWTDSHDNKGVTGYTVTVDDGTPQSVTGTTVTLSDLDLNEQHTIQITARDAAGNVSLPATLVHSPSDYLVTVVGSTDDAATSVRYAPGATVTVTAREADEERGESFSGWRATGITLADASQKTITFTMPAQPVTLTAIFSSDAVVNQATVSATAFSAAGGELTVTLTGANLEDGIAVRAGTLTAATAGTDAAQTATFNLPANTGNAAVVYPVQYQWDGAWTDVDSVTVRAAIKLTVTGFTGAYDGQEHTVEVVATPADATIKYRTADSGDYTLTTAPKYTDVGSYTVYYQATKTDMDSAEGQAVVSITKAAPKLTLTATPSSLTTDGEVTLTLAAPAYASADGLTVTTTDTILDEEGNEQPLTLTREGNVWKVTLPSDVKTYTFTAALAETDNYAAATASCTVSVRKPSASNPAVPVISTGTTDDGFPTTTETRPDGTKVDTTEKPDGTKEIVETKPDGTVTETTEKPDGTKESTETKPDGTVTESVEKSDGSKEAVETKPDGTVTETKIDAEGAKVEKVTDPEENVTITATDAEGETVAEVKVPAVIPEAEKRFEDVPVGHWADEAIHKLAAIEVVNGVTDTQYSPVVPMKRGDLATVLFRLSNGKEGLTDTFADVESGKYYADGIAWAAKAGVVEGYSDTEFRPEQTITREQLALMLMRYAKLLGVDTSADAGALNAFADGGKTSSWAVDGVAWCVKAGIIQGMDDVTLSPNTNVSRAQVAVMLQRFIDLVK